MAKKTTTKTGRIVTINVELPDDAELSAVPDSIDVKLSAPDVYGGRRTWRLDGTSRFQPNAPALLGGKVQFGPPTLSYVFDAAAVTAAREASKNKKLLAELTRKGIPDADARKLLGMS